MPAGGAFYLAEQLRECQAERDVAREELHHQKELHDQVTSELTTLQQQHVVDSEVAVRPIVRPGRHEMAWNPTVHVLSEWASQQDSDRVVLQVENFVSLVERQMHIHRYNQMDDVGQMTPRRMMERLHNWHGALQTAMVELLECADTQWLHGEMLGRDSIHNIPPFSTASLEVMRGGAVTAVTCLDPGADPEVLVCSPVEAVRRRAAVATGDIRQQAQNDLIRVGQLLSPTILEILRGVAAGTRLELNPTEADSSLLGHDWAIHVDREGVRLSPSVPAAMARPQSRQVDETNLEGTQSSAVLGLQGVQPVQPHLSAPVVTEEQSASDQAKAEAAIAAADAVTHAADKGPEKEESMITDGAEDYVQPSPQGDDSAELERIMASMQNSRSE